MNACSPCQLAPSTIGTYLYKRGFHKKYGKIFKERLGPVTNLSISDPALVEEILRTEGKYPFRPPYQSWVLYNELYNRKGGTMTADGEHWKKCRSVMNPKFLRPKAVGEFVEGINGVVASFVDRLRLLKDATGDGEPIPHLPNELSKFTMEALGWVLLDKRLGCLEEHVEEKVQNFISSIATMFLTGHQLMIFANVHQKLNTKPWRNHVRSWNTIYEIAQDYIDERMKDVAERLSGDIKEGERVDFLTYLVGSGKLSREEIYVNITEVLLGGVDTAANSFSFLLYSLAKHTESQDILLEEVDRVLGGKVCSYEDLQRMPYLKAVVKETLRLYPPIPINARVMQEDTVIDNTLIPKGTIVLLNKYTMARDEKIFTNPDKFIPERWLRAEAKDWHPFSSIPFGYGARSCVGRRIAETEIYLATVGICQKFRMSVSDKFDIKPSVRTQLTPGPELPILFTER
ncbi:hypothetical protein LOTGIDRAFT_239424 [Lottia gigantea]|uniref:Cholesterol side-chain cleavage enzyme, mitochondrial n=1 Tax=Lottia gigantea TaxID=225164 RepID=V4C287_LOTGI|nr:hypothetical protein LOTGIDRAFT_239424 [Lottia gigantea]ESO95609.1 hypothetical protein LOTGIDRAFT_239424 [Lottia gigantea]